MVNCMQFDIASVYDPIDNIDDRKKARAIMEYIEFCRQSGNKGIEWYESLIAQIVLTRCGVRTILAIVRTCGAYVRYTSNDYRIFVQAVYNHFVTMQLNADSLLIGILPLSTKPIVKFKTSQFQYIKLNEPAVIFPLNHPSDLVSNTGLIMTSKVINYHPIWNAFETLNTIYVNIDRG